MNTNRRPYITYDSESNGDPRSPKKESVSRAGEFGRFNDEATLIMDTMDPD